MSGSVNPVTGLLDPLYVPIPDSLRYAVGHYASEKMPFTLVRPAPASAASGFFSADHYGYVGRETQIRICAQGGAFPHSVVIDQAPSGAAIDNDPMHDDYLVLKFTPTSNGAQTINLRLYDAIGKMIRIRYTFTTSENWCVFISPTGNDTTGDGTKANPWATRAKAFATATGGKCLILENGTYSETTMGLDFTSSKINSMVSWSQRGAIIDLAAVSSTGTGVMVTTNASHIHIQGIIFRNPPTSVANPRFFSGDNSSQYLHMDNCKFDIDGRSGTVNNDNVSCWMQGGDTGTDRRYVSQTRCEFTGFAGLANGWSSIDIYATSKCVISHNKFSDQRSSTTSAGLVYIKGVRNNGVDFTCNEFQTPFAGGVVDFVLGNAGDADNVTGNFHAAFNIIRSIDPAGIWVGRADQAGIRLPVWSSRNTTIGGTIIIFDHGTDYPLTFTSDGDVIQSTVATSDPWKVAVRRDGAYYPLSSRPNLTATVTNYECQQNSGVVDSNARLTGAYVVYEGVRGHYITRGA